MFFRDFSPIIIKIFFKKKFYSDFQICGENSMRKNTIKHIIVLGRLHFLLGGFLLFCIGVALALFEDIVFSVERFIFGYAILLPAHLSLSYSNNYFDAEADRNNELTAISGGSKLLEEYPHLKKFCKWFAVLLIVISVSISILFSIIYNYHPIFVLFVICGNLLAWYYAAPPLKLSYRGMGEVSTALAYGFLMPGIGYLIINPRFDSLFFIFSLPLLLYGLIFIITVELPDMEGDTISGKKTLVVRIGRRYAVGISAIAAGIGTCYFFLSSKIYSVNASIDFMIVGLLSIIPLTMGLAGMLAKLNERVKSIKVTYGNLTGIIVFMLALTIYLLMLLNSE
jgi:1,4-dihydroxy-2-naphthoate octaprenyltransferase